MVCYIKCKRIECKHYLINVLSYIAFWSRFESLKEQLNLGLSTQQLNRPWNVRIRLVSRLNAYYLTHTQYKLAGRKHVPIHDTQWFFYWANLVLSLCLTLFRTIFWIRFGKVVKLDADIFLIFHLLGNEAYCVDDLHTNTCAAELYSKFLVINTLLLTMMVMLGFSDKVLFQNSDTVRSKQIKDMGPAYTGNAKCRKPRSQ